MEMEIKMVKVLSLPPDALPKDQMDKLVSTLCPPEGEDISF
jgi:hypothetical protein